MAATPRQVRPEYIWPKQKDLQLICGVEGHPVKARFWPSWVMSENHLVPVRTGKYDRHVRLYGLPSNRHIVVGIDQTKRGIIITPRFRVLHIDEIHTIFERGV